MLMDPDEPRVVRSENPVREMWSRLSYFETESNARDFLTQRFNISDDAPVDAARSLAFAMRPASEYYESASCVSLLTKPLLVCYGMAALSKVLFIATYGQKSPSRSHGLEPPIPQDFVCMSVAFKRV
jgi:hypothetical protein